MAHFQSQDLMMTPDRCIRLFKHDIIGKPELIQQLTYYVGTPEEILMLPEPYRSDVKEYIATLPSTDEG